MFTIAICDDDTRICNVLNEYVNKYFGESKKEIELKIFNSGEKLLKELGEKEIEVNLLFLDIEMPGRNGIEVKKVLETDKHVEKILFVTSHQEIMQEAFGMKVVGFVDKPFKEETIVKWIGKVYKEYSNRKSESKKVIEIGGESFKATDIKYIRSEGNYIICRMEDDTESNALRSAIAPVLEQLDDAFKRIHRSYVINLKYVEKVRYKGVTMVGGEVLPIGRQYIDETKKAYDEYILAKVTG